MYQGATLRSFNQKTLQYCKQQALADIEQLNEKMRRRLEWSHVKMLRSFVTFTDTQGLQTPVCSGACSTSEEEGDKVLIEILSVVDFIFCFFKQPLEVKGVSMLALRDEVEEVVEYTSRYYWKKSETSCTLLRNERCMPDRHKLSCIYRYWKFYISLNISFTTGHFNLNCTYPVHKHATHSFTFPAVQATEG